MNPFYCRQFWLKKGYDYAAGKTFAAADAVVDLGVGKNMATSILYWSKCFNVLDEKQEPTEFANLCFRMTAPIPIGRCRVSLAASLSVG